MPERALSQIHIIEPDVRRRAAIFNQMKSCALHAELYESITEFCDVAPSKGGVLANDDGDGPTAPTLLEKMKACDVFLPVAMYSTDPAPNKVVKAVRSGAIDYLAWPFDQSQLERTCDLLAESFGIVAEETQKAEARALIARLSTREREVLAHLLRGGTNKTLARAMDISPRTVELHRSHMMHKLGANSTAEAVRIGLLADLVNWKAPPN